MGCVEGFTCPYPYVTRFLPSLRSGQAGSATPRNDIIRGSFRGRFSGRGIGDFFHKSCWSFSTRDRFLPSLRSGQAGSPTPRNDIIRQSSRFLGVCGPSE
jgi:hypothetical protein